MIIDPIGDLLTRIRNGQLRRKAKINSPNSRLRIRLLDVIELNTPGTLTDVDSEFLHDLRSPLTAVLGYVELLGDET